MKSKAALIFILATASACSGTKVPFDEVVEEIYSNPEGKGQQLEITMIRGEGHNHPLMAIWVESPEGEFIQTLYVAESIGKGVFRHGDKSEGFWQPGEIQRPAALPRWSHRRGILNENNFYLPTPASPVPDAYTCPTPDKSFALLTRLDEKAEGQLVLFFEINQTWDWNEYWTNNKFPDDEEYKTSCQPALVYAATLDFSKPSHSGEYFLEIMGRSHQSGADGEIYTDLETMTTALHIAGEISVRIVE